jgi:hypothetical protein
VKDAVSFVLDQDFVVKFSARFDAFSSFKVGKKSHTTFSTFNLCLTLKMNSKNRSLGTIFHLLADVVFLPWKFQVAQISHYRNRVEPSFVVVFLDTMIVRLFLRCRLVGAHLHFVRYYGQRPSLRRRFSQRYDCPSRDNVEKRWTLES